MNLNACGWKVACDANDGCVRPGDCFHEKRLTKRERVSAHSRKKSVHDLNAHRVDCSYANDANGNGQVPLPRQAQCVSPDSSAILGLLCRQHGCNVSVQKMTEPTTEHEKIGLNGVNAAPTTWTVAQKIDGHSHWVRRKIRPTPNRHS